MSVIVKDNTRNRMKVVMVHIVHQLSFQCTYLVARRATYVLDGRFFGHFFWKVEGSSVHTHESRATHMCHMQLTCGKLLYGGGEPSHVAHVCHMWHVWQLMCTLLLYGGGEPSRVANMCHMWQLTCTLLLYHGGEPSRVAHVCHMWQLICTLLLYGRGEPSRVAHVHGN